MNWPLSFPSLNVLPFFPSGFMRYLAGATELWAGCRTAALSVSWHPVPSSRESYEKLSVASLVKITRYVLQCLYLSSISYPGRQERGAVRNRVQGKMCPLQDRPSDLLPLMNPLFLSSTSSNSVVKFEFSNGLTHSWSPNPQNVTVSGNDLRHTQSWSWQIS